MNNDASRRPDCRCTSQRWRMRIDTILTKLGHLAPAHQLLTSGVSRRTIDRLRGAGTLITPRHGWLATEAAYAPAVIATLHGARLTASTALRTYEVWAGEDSSIHLQVAPGHRFRSYRSAVPIERFTPMPHTGSDVVRHWAPLQATQLDEPAWRVSVVDALIRHVIRIDDEQALASITSAVVEHRMPQAHLDTLFARLPRRLNRLRSALSLHDGSGLETVARIRLGALGYSLEQQVRIGPDRVDLVLNGWLVIELDGDRWHDQREDRARTNRLVRAGYRVLRFGYHDVLHDWATTVLTIERALVEPWSRPWQAADSTHQTVPN